MTWKKSFFKTTLHDIGKRSWCLALIFVIQFFAIPVRALLSIQSQQSVFGNDRSIYYRDEMQRLFEGQIFNFGSGMLIFVLILSAILLAMSGYSYLNSKKKVDFIHSMPIRREALFLSRYLVGILLYMVPLLLNVGIGLLIAVYSKGFTGFVLKSALWMLLYHLVYFMLFYGTAILAIVLIGNFVVSFLGMGVLFAYQSVMAFMVKVFKSSFFATYMQEYDTSWARDPLGILIKQLDSFHNNYFQYDYAGRAVRIGKEYLYTTGWKMCLFALFGALVAGGVAFVLFRLRKSEAAGKTLVFPISEPIIKVALLLPSGIIGGMIMRTIASGYWTAWYLFGAGIGFFLAAIIIEIIFRQDFKSLFKHKVSALVGAMVIATFSLCFQLDIFGFDARIPKENKIESVGVSFPGVENSDEYLDEYSEILSSASDFSEFGLDYQYDRERFSSFFDKYSYFANSDYILQLCRITGKEKVEKVRALASYYKENEKEFEKRADEDEYYIMKEYGNPQEDIIFDETEEDKQWITCNVVYRLKNGKEIYRSYKFPYGKEFLEVAEPVFAEESYKLAANPALQSEKNYRYLQTNDNFVVKRISISHTDMEEIMECYRKDVMNQTFEEVFTQNLKGTFQMINSLGSSYSNAYRIYEGSEYTLNWLASHGVTMDVDLNDIDVTGASIEIYGVNGYKEIYPEEDAQLQELAKYAIREEYVAPIRKNNSGMDIQVMLQYSITSQDDNIVNDGSYADGGYYSNWYTIPGELPDFIKEEL